MWKRLAFTLGGLLLLVIVIALLELAYPKDRELPPIDPVLTRVSEREILIDGGVIDQLRFKFSDEDSIEHVDDVYRCLEIELEAAFGEESLPQGKTRWSRQMDVGKRLRKVEELCGD